MSNGDPWDGTERRQRATDHDTLIEVVQILKNHVSNFDKHIIDDKKNFDFLNKSVWMVFGAIAVVELYSKLVR